MFFVGFASIIGPNNTLIARKRDIAEKILKKGGKEGVLLKTYHASNILNIEAF